MHIDKRYLIIPTVVVDNINFSQVYETSKESLRYSTDSTKTFVKYDVTVYEEDVTYTLPNLETGGEITTTIHAGVYGRPSIYHESYPEYTHEQMLTVLNQEEWSINLITI